VIDVTEHFVTLFDSTFLPNGVALHKSLTRHAGDFHLWVICMDETTERAITALKLEHVSLLPLATVETHELLTVKKNRSIAEYCWTLTPFSIDFVFDRDPSIQRVTYLDADVWFARSPSELLAEMESTGAQLLITPHAYSAEHAANVRFGTYCVQFMPFNRDGSREVRTDWQTKCLDWCHAVAEPNRFGDQKYLDTWTEQFPELVHVLESVEKTQAPWNAVDFDAVDAVMYHFHRLRLASESRAFVGTYRIPYKTITTLYRPYLADIKSANEDLAELGFNFKPQIQAPTGWPLVKDYLDFRRHNWRGPFSPYSVSY
jgi:hypothetical protein